MEKSLGPTELRRWDALTVLIVGNSLIRKVHRRIFDQDVVTDVISLQYGPLPGEADVVSGEAFVNVQRAVERKTARSNWNASTELALYIAHACDHLAGEDDSSDIGRKRMRRRELRWLKEAATQGLIDGILQQE